MSTQLYSRFPALKSPGTPTDPRTGQPIAPGIHWSSGRPFQTGARRSPPQKLAAAMPHRVLRATPPQACWFPKMLNIFGNDQYGDCVSAEEGFAKLTYGLDGQGNALLPEVDLPPQVVIDWASRHGYLNGADLSSVMDDMIRGGFVVGSQTYNDGSYSSVDWTNEAVLQNAIAQGPIKIAIAAGVLPSGAGNHQGWYITGNHGGINSTDHCVSIAGFGPAGWLFDQLNKTYGNVSLPSGISATAMVYAVYTWATIGVVDHQWLVGTVPEAWLRNPTTVGVPPLPPIVPPQPPGPPVATFSVPQGLLIPEGEYVIGDPSNPTAMVWLQGEVAAGSYPVNIPSPPALK